MYQQYTVSVKPLSSDTLRQQRNIFSGMPDQLVNDLPVSQENPVNGFEVDQFVQIRVRAARFIGLANEADRSFTGGLECDSFTSQARDTIRRDR